MEGKGLLTEDQQRKAMTDILKKLRFESMDEAKCVLKWLLHYDEMDGRLPFNTLMQQIYQDKLPYGWDWGWKNLNWDILSNKYGAAALRNERKKQTYFTLRLPPVVKLEHRKTIFDEGSIFCFDPISLLSN